MVHKNSKVLDHSLLICSFDIATICDMSNIKNVHHGPQPKMYNDNKLPQGFLVHEEANAKLKNLIELIQTCRETQAGIDNMYDKFTEMVLEEMQNKLPLCGAPGRNKH